MNKEILVEYVNLYNMYKTNPNIVYTKEQLDIINKVQSARKNDVLLNDLISKIMSSPETNWLQMINEYFIKEAPQKKEEEVISETFGIDISKIEHKYLENGKEIFKFYDSKLGRDVILENKKDGLSLVEQLKQMQLENNAYQTANNEKNTMNMLDERRKQDNIEMSIIPINEVENHMNELQNMKVEDMQKLNFLIKNASVLGITSINIENIFGIDQTGKILEVKHDKEKNIYTIEEPKQAVYSSENINVADKLNENINPSEQTNMVQNEYEDKPRTIEEFDNLPEETKNQIKKYNEYPELLEMLPEEERKQWQEYIELYNKIEQEKQQSIKDTPKKKIYKKQETGFADVLLLSLITGFLGGVLTTLIMILTQK